MVVIAPFDLWVLLVWTVAVFIIVVTADVPYRHRRP